MGFPGVTLSRPSEFQRASYLDSTTTGTRHSDSTRIAMRFAMLLDGVSFLFTSSFNSLCVGAALAWIIYRAIQVLHKPLDELVSLLGFEIPVGPAVDLADIKANGVVLHWKAAEDRKSTQKYEVQVNVGELSPTDTSVIISGLQPEQFYVIRVIVVNTSEFRSPSDAVRICTKPADSGDFFPHTAPPTASEGQDGAQPESIIKIRPFKAFQDPFASAIVAPPMVREISGGPGQPRRIVSGRRTSPAVLGNDAHPSTLDEAEPEESQQQLAQKFDEIGREIREIEKQLQEEDQEAIATKAELLKERDEARADLKKKEENSRNLRKEVNALERTNATAQSKKAAQERALSEKRNERQKLKDDTIRWEKETLEFQEDMERLKSEKQSLLENAEQEKQALQEKYQEELDLLKRVEEENRDKGAQIKKLERDKTDSPENAVSVEGNNYDLHAQDIEEDRMWEARWFQLNAEYRTAIQQVESAKQYYHSLSGQLAMMKQRQSELAQAAPQPLFDTSMSRASSLRQQPRRTPSGPAVTNVSSSSGFPITAGPTIGNGMPSVGPSLPNTSSPFWLFHTSGTEPSQRSGDRPTSDSGMSQSEMEILTGGAPMSPSAGAELLPRGLLNEKEDSPPGLQPSAEFNKTRREEDTDSEGRQPSILPGLGPLSGLGMIPGLGAPQTRDLQGPTSPGSAGSRSPSLFASPRASTHNLTFSPVPDNGIDSDRRSTRSARSNRAASGSALQSGSRFTQILGLDKLANRPRGKTLSEDGPTLGSLSKEKSQSMPRNAEETVEEEPPLSRRRNSSHSGNFFGVLNRNFSSTKSPGASDFPKAIPAHRRAFNMFSSAKNSDGWGAILGGDGNRPSSPRPGSTHSTELPRPSQESTNWAFWPTTNEPFGQRSSPLSADWGMPSSALSSGARNWGSRHPSRRPSIQHGASGVSYDIIEDEADTDTADLLSSTQPPPQAPIGTKPSPVPATAESPTAAKLNPAAKTFTLFSRDRRGKNRAVDVPQTPDHDADLPTSSAGLASAGATTPHAAPGAPDPRPSSLLSSDHDFSPPTSRKSRDARSILTAESAASFTEQSSRNSLDRQSSTPASEAQGATPGSLQGRESFMAKLTRKSSSGKFGLPSFGKRRREVVADVDVGEEEEDLAQAGAGAGLGRSVDSIGAGAGAEREREMGKNQNRGSGRSWSSVFGKGRRERGEREGRGETPSLSEASAASEDEEGEEEE
ncbi:hypothetical protein M8818_003279 [Zalaria obscura]|uniref:Uncharacterized protein n=1 Tax=Zalaria obscura TaxID=2024903 RepID=A0ACC3SF47_9PEZI